MRFKREFEQCASIAPPSTACDGSGAQAKLEPAALEPAQSEQAKSEQAQSEPPRKKRRRRGIRDRRLCLNDDMMAVVLPYVSRTSVKHLLLLSMVDRNLRDLVGGAHDMWRDIFRRWERLYYSRFSHSIAEEFATRCLQAMPVWMAPHGQSRVDFANRGVRVWNLQRVLPPLPHGSDWRDNGVPADRRVVFDRFVRKAMALVHIGCCGLCGTRQRSQRPVWSLGIRVCQPCWEGNVISNRALLQVRLALLVGLVRLVGRVGLVGLVTLVIPVRPVRLVRLVIFVRLVIPVRLELTRLWHDSAMASTC